MACAREERIRSRPISGNHLRSVQREHRTQRGCIGGRRGFGQASTHQRRYATVLGYGREQGLALANRVGTQAFFFPVTCNDISGTS